MEFDAYEGHPGWEKLPGWERVRSGFAKYHTALVLLFGAAASIPIVIWLFGMVLPSMNIRLQPSSVQLIWLVVFGIYATAHVFLFQGLIRLMAVPAQSGSKTLFLLTLVVQTVGLLAPIGLVIGYLMVGDGYERVKYLRSIQGLQQALQGLSLFGLVFMLVGTKKLGSFVGRPDLATTAVKLMASAVALTVAIFFARSLIKTLGLFFLPAITLAGGLFFYILVDLMGRCRDALDPELLESEF